jgi:membrane associated rhomboid family serine protease
MAGAFTSLLGFFRRQSVLSSLLLINLLVFVLIKAAMLVCVLFLWPTDPLVDFLKLPASVGGWLHRPWTMVTYMFTHLEIWHIAFNLLCLYWSGQLFLRFFGPKQLGGLYVLGGVAGGVLFMLMYNVFPYFEWMLEGGVGLVGASAAVMAILFATAFYRKDLKINLILFGGIKLIYIALFFLLIDLVSMERSNSGGHIAHIGGALMGIWFARAAIGGRDLTAGINGVIDWIVNLFAKRKRRKTKLRQVYRQPETDREYNQRKHDEQVEIDKILDKIKRSGYNSLSENEKKRLFDASR